MNELPNEMPVLSIQAFQRMPDYLQYLKKLRDDKVETISSARVAEHFHFTEIQVRKDFSAVSTSKGKPKSGFSVSLLIESIENYLGFRNANEAVLVGVGSLGQALLAYGGFEVYGMNIVAAFDSDLKKVGTEIHGRVVLASDKISETCRRMHIQIGIITVPADHAQLVCDQFVAGGVKAIWNFAPVHLSVPNGILVLNENMAVSLAMLSKHLRDTMRADR